MQDDPGRHQIESIDRREACARRRGLELGPVAAEQREPVGEWQVRPGPGPLSEVRAGRGRVLVPAIDQERHVDVTDVWCEPAVGETPDRVGSDESFAEQGCGALDGGVNDAPGSGLSVSLGADHYTVTSRT